MPYILKSGSPEVTAPEYMEMIKTIELYLQQTREVLDRIEGHIKELKKEKSFKEEKTPAREDPMKKYFSAPVM